MPFFWAIVSFYSQKELWEYSKVLPVWLVQDQAESPAPASRCFPISSVISSRTPLSFAVEGCAEAALDLLPVFRKVGVVIDVSVFKLSFHFNKYYVTIQASQLNNHLSSPKPASAGSHIRLPASLSVRSSHILLSPRNSAGCCHPSLRSGGHELFVFPQSFPSACRDGLRSLACCRGDS